MNVEDIKKRIKNIANIYEEIIKKFNNNLLNIKDNSILEYIETLNSESYNTCIASIEIIDAFTQMQQNFEFIYLRIMQDAKEFQKPLKYISNPIFCSVSEKDLQTLYLKTLNGQNYIHNSKIDNYMSKISFKSIDNPVVKEELILERKNTLTNIQEKIVEINEFYERKIKDRLKSTKSRDKYIKID